MVVTSGDPIGYSMYAHHDLFTATQLPVICKRFANVLICVGKPFRELLAVAGRIADIVSRITSGKCEHVVITDEIDVSFADVTNGVIWLRPHTEQPTEALIAQAAHEAGHFAVPPARFWVKWVRLKPRRHRELATRAAMLIEDPQVNAWLSANGFAEQVRWLCDRMFDKPETRYDTLQQCIAELVLYDRLKRPEVFDQLSQADQAEIRAIADAARHATTEREKRACAERYYCCLKPAYDLEGD